MTGHDAAAIFEAQRRRLTGLAYRMLGSLAAAEDAVQEAYLRWHGAARDEIDDPKAFLSTVVTRLCLDHLKSAAAQREHYVGPWLPEPVLDDGALAADTASDYALDLSVALMLALERLSPLERAAFLLHDVFDVGFADVARALGRNEAACRQLAARARDHVRVSRPRFPSSPEEGERLAHVFRQAAAQGDTSVLARLLAADAVLYTDGGGKRVAALNPIRGADKIERFFIGVMRKSVDPAEARVRPQRINGLPGFVVIEADGTVTTIALETDGGKITAIYAVRNPEKLRHVRA